MKRACYEDLGFACVDTDRQRRRGFPEVVYCQHKTPREIIAIVRVLLKHPVVHIRHSNSTISLIVISCVGLTQPLFRLLLI